MADADGQFEHLKFQHFEVPLINGKPVELGRGAMGVTYKAHDANLQVPVALKVISPAMLGDATTRSRFLREARSAAALRHANVATVVFLGEQEDQVFYAMEFVEGETVADYVKREQGMSPAFALEIVGQVAAALVAAEREGIVHRDLKPANIMLTTTDDSDVLVKVIDFGLAKNVDTPADASVTLTQGGFLGTPLYASPEQLAEESVDTRSDIYSLGVTLFYMLMGHAPFLGSTAQVMSQHLSKDPPWEEIEDQPAAVLELLRAMLAKDPNERVQTAVELRQRIVDCRSQLNGATEIGDRELNAGELLNDRYRITAVEPVGDELLRITAVDRQGEAEVEVWMPSTVNPAREGLAAETRRELASLAKVGVRGVRQVVDEGWTRGRWFVALEQLPGPTLLDVVRSPGALGLEAFLPGLRQLAVAADRLAELDLPLAGFSLNEVRVAGSGDAADNLEDLWVDPVRVEGTLADGTLGTISAGPTLPPMGKRGAIKAIGSLAYEVLGGVRLAPGGNWVPVAELSEGANRALRRAVSSGDSSGPGFQSAVEFVNELAGQRAGGVGAGRKTENPIAAPVPRKEVAPTKSRWPMGLAAALVALILAVIGWSLVGPGAKSDTTDEGRAAVVTAARTRSTPTPTPTGTPTAAEREAERDEAAFAKARELELADSYEEALLAYAALADSPTKGKGAIPAIEQIATKMGGNFPTGLSPDELDRLRGALEIGAENGGGSSQQLLGSSLRGINDREALRWLEAAADNGRVEAMVLAGLMLSNGAGLPQPDMKRAAERFAQAADQRNLNGRFYLAECYRDGLGVEADPARAAELAEAAAQDGDERAMMMLGHLYRKGEGVPRDPAKAREKFQAAIAIGALEAKAALGVMIMNGEGAPADPDGAVAMWREGAEAEDPTCMFYYARSLTDPRFGNNQSEARQWFARAAAAGNVAAAEWCVQNGVAISEGDRP